MKARTGVLEFAYLMGWRNGIVIAMLDLNNDNLDLIS